MKFKLLSGLLVALFANCSFAAVDSVRVSSRLDPNAIIITEVDIIFIYDQALIADFPATKSQWYSGKRDFTREAGDAIDVVNIFIPQGFDGEDASLPVRRGDAVKVLVIAYHDDSQAAPVDITASANVLIEIDPFGIVVSSVE